MYRAEVYKNAWARDIRDSYGNMKDFSAWVEGQNIQPD